MDTKMNKRIRISNWKNKGVKCDNFDELYYIYMKTLNCSHCGKEFKNSRDRHLDHNHSTGLFRAIVCRKCNTHDSYINYPDGYDKRKYIKKNKEKITKQVKEYFEKNKECIVEYKKEYYKQNKQQINEKSLKKYDCGCGGKYQYSSKSKHFKTFKHIDWFMEQVD